MTQDKSQIEVNRPKLPKGVLLGLIVGFLGGMALLLTAVLSERSPDNPTLIEQARRAKDAKVAP